MFYRGQDDAYHHTFFSPGGGLTPEVWVGPGIGIDHPAALYTEPQQHLFFRTHDGGISVFFSSRGITLEFWAKDAFGDPGVMYTSAGDQQQVFFHRTAGPGHQCTAGNTLGSRQAMGSMFSQSRWVKLSVRCSRTGAQFFVVQAADGFTELGIRNRYLAVDEPGNQLFVSGRHTDAVSVIRWHQSPPNFPVVSTFAI